MFWREKNSKFSALPNEDHMQKLLSQLPEGFFCPFQALFLCKLLSYSSLPCKDLRERSKNTSKGKTLFAQDTICGKHFPFMVMARKQRTAQKNCGSKIAINFTAQKCKLRSSTEKLETGLNLFSLYNKLPKKASTKMAKSNKGGRSAS